MARKPIAQAGSEEVTLFDLLLSEDTYSSQDAARPNSARRLQSFIPSLNGQLTRELGLTKYLPTQMGSPSAVGSVFQYNYNDASGNRQSKQFAATSTQLFMEVAGAWVAQTLPTNNGLTSSTPLADYPFFTIVNNLLHISDGTTNWIYDGPNAAFVIDGFPIPLTIPNFNETIAGTFSCTVGRYYWFTWADETDGRVHESSSSPISGSTGALSNKKVRVYPVLAAPDGGGGVNTTSGSKAVTSPQPNFDATMVGLHLWVAGVDFGAIASFTSTTSITLAANAPGTNTGAQFVVAPARATHIHIYGSETEGSRLGKFFGSIAIAGNASPFLDDQSPFINQPNTTILDIDRPVRNDPPPGSKLQEYHKFRIFRRRETKPNFFLFSALDEVSSGDNGSPQESYPGTDVNTISDIVNEDSYPKQSNRIRALCSHNDALYIATENEIIPLYGDLADPNDFALSEVTSIRKGAAGRWAMISTGYGIAFISYDRKALLLPNMFTPVDIDVTTQLIEIGQKMRAKLQLIKSSDLDNVRLLHYDFGDRNWLVLAFQDSSNVYHTWVYDFDIKGWFELQQGFTSLALFEVSAGNKVLVGGTTDGFVYVVDDQTGTYTPPATCPSAIFRPALIDFGNPGAKHIPKYIEIDLTNAALADSISLNYYLDPPDANNPDPTTMRTADWNLAEGETNIFRAWFERPVDGQEDGVVCKRILLEFSAASDTNTGSIRGLLLKAEPVSNLG